MLKRSYAALVMIAILMKPSGRGIRKLPLSFLLANDVKEGRREVNFSTWTTYNDQRRARKLKEIVKEVQSGEMPPWYYVPLHPNAKLSPTDRQAIINWAKQD